ncbi:phosphate-starvation-inducible PsiE family protein [Nitrosococcus wardiae]|uniref:phosphate-starvation-inducible PsiE family protein n=1 Tax=Nitrosococcus wardiae TaxID=1814290 RepID=UPI001F0FD963|nr:phosphate-starvation-inducible PsiE family protein [Nitrosococcus wardiae]
MKISYRLIFDRITNYIFAVLLIFITMGLVIGVLRLFLSLGDLVIHADISSGYLHIISEVLTLFILIELSRSLVEYFNTHRLRMTFIVDAGIVFVLREVMIKLFEESLAVDEVYAMSVLLFVLGALRIGSVLVFQREKQVLDHHSLEGSN